MLTIRYDVVNIVELSLLTAYSTEMFTFYKRIDDLGSACICSIQSAVLAATFLSRNEIWIKVVK